MGPGRFQAKELRTTMDQRSGRIGEKKVKKHERVSGKGINREAARLGKGMYLNLNRLTLPRMTPKKLWRM